MLATEDTLADAGAGNVAGTSTRTEPFSGRGSESVSETCSVPVAPAVDRSSTADAAPRAPTAMSTDGGRPAAFADAVAELIALPPASSSTSDGKTPVAPLTCGLTTPPISTATPTPAACAAESVTSTAEPLTATACKMPPMLAVAAATSKELGKVTVSLSPTLAAALGVYESVAVTPVAPAVALLSATDAAGEPKAAATSVIAAGRSSALFATVTSSPSPSRIATSEKMEVLTAADGFCSLSVPAPSLGSSERRCAPVFSATSDPSPLRLMVMVCPDALMDAVPSKGRTEAAVRLPCGTWKPASSVRRRRPSTGIGASPSVKSTSRDTPSAPATAELREAVTRAANAAGAMAGASGSWSPDARSRTSPVDAAVWKDVRSASGVPLTSGFRTPSKDSSTVAPATIAVPSPPRVRVSTLPLAAPAQDPEVPEPLATAAETVVGSATK